MEKNNLLEDVIEESTRLQPLFLTIINDIETYANKTAFLGHLINRYSTKNSSRNIILLLQETNETYFYKQSKFQPNSNVKIIKDIINFNLEKFDDNYLKTKLSSMIKNDSSNVLVINPINPLLLLFDPDDNNKNENVAPSLFMFIKNMKSLFQHVILNFHYDNFMSDDLMDAYENR